MKPQIRIDNDGVMGHQTRIFFIDKEGNETEISAACRSVSLDLNVGEVNRARVEMIKVGGNVRAELTDLVVREFKPRRKLTRWLRKMRNISVFRSDAVQEYIP